MKVQKIKEHKTDDVFRIQQHQEYTGDDYWNWSVWIEASDANLNKIESVIYNLHYSFKEPVKIIKTRKNKFRLDTAGWGTFTIYARINFKDETVLELQHELELLYPDGNVASE
jgi:transcription initiation factor IIF auxiliary subunit